MTLKVYDPDRDLLRLARDLAVVQALRRGVDVPERELGEVRDLGQVMVALEDAEKEARQIERKRR